LKAHFQFTYTDLVDNYNQKRLSDDLVAHIPDPNGQKYDNTLTLKIKDLACPRHNPRYYAIWIEDSSLPSGGMFAVGDNPPPEMDVGP
ncbi:MAG: hypothetical protein JSW50_14495, partial [Candidatus Latescibacterota bacterium]